MYRHKMYYSAIAVLVLGIVLTINASPIHEYPGVVTMTANVEVPKPCVAPSVFEGRVTELGSGPVGNVVVLANISYDATAERIRMYEVILLPKNQTMIQDVLVLYKKGIIYDRDAIKGTCFKGHVPKVFPTIRVEKDATYTGDFFFGKTFSLHSWRQQVPAPNTVTVWTADGNCYPVSQTVMLNEPPSTSVRSYFNITLGIKDPSVWDIPAGCHQAAPWKGNSQHKYLGKRWYL